MPLHCSIELRLLQNDPRYEETQGTALNHAKENIINKATPQKNKHHKKHMFVFMNLYEYCVLPVNSDHHIARCQYNISTGHLLKTEVKAVQVRGAHFGPQGVI